MQILAIHRYYWPDAAPYGLLLRSILGHLAANGHRASVFTSEPSYNLVRPLSGDGPAVAPDGVVVKRLPMRSDRAGTLVRILNMLRFSLIAAWRVLAGPRQDVVMCSTVPQVLLGWLVSLACRMRRICFVYHCMDLHPELGAISGEFSNPLVYRLLMAMDTATCRRASLIIVLSEDMRGALLRRDPELASRITVLNNFELPLEEMSIDEPSPLPRDGGRVRVTFAGNLGRFQGLDAIVTTVLEGPNELDDLELVLMGSGAMEVPLAELVARAPARRQGRVSLVPHGSPASAQALMRESDYGLVSLAPGVIQFAYPSKTATYLAQGLPVLLAVDEESEIVESLTADGVGELLPLDPEKMSDALVRVVSRGRPTEAHRRLAREYGAEQMSSAQALPVWADLLVGLVRA